MLAFTVRSILFGGGVVFHVGEDGARRDGLVGEEGERLAGLVGSTL